MTDPTALVRVAKAAEALVEKLRDTSYESHQWWFDVQLEALEAALRDAAKEE